MGGGTLRGRPEIENNVTLSRNSDKYKPKIEFILTLYMDFDKYVAKYGEVIVDVKYEI